MSRNISPQCLAAFERLGRLLADFADDNPSWYFWSDFNPSGPTIVMRHRFIEVTYNFRNDDSIAVDIKTRDKSKHETGHVSNINYTAVYRYFERLQNAEDWYIANYLT